MALYDIKDIALNDDMDISIENGDISISNDISALVYIIAFRVLSDPADWRIDPSAVLGLDRYIGQVNDEELRDQMRTDILVIINQGLSLNPADVEVTFEQDSLVPTSAVIEISITDMEYVDLDGNAHSNLSVTIGFDFDLNSGKLTFIDDLL